MPCLAVNRRTTAAPRYQAQPARQPRNEARTRRSARAVALYGRAASRRGGSRWRATSGPRRSGRSSRPPLPRASSGLVTTRMKKPPAQFVERYSARRSNARARGAPLEVIQAEFVLQFAVLLFDRPPTAREPDELLPRRLRVQIEHVVRSRVVRQRSLEQRPPFATPVAQAHPSRGKAGDQRPFRTVSPTHPAPGRRRQPLSHRLERLGGAGAWGPRFEQAPHRHRVPQAHPFERGPKPCRRAVVRVGDHGRGDTARRAHRRAAACSSRATSSVTCSAALVQKRPGLPERPALS